MTEVLKKLYTASKKMLMPSLRQGGHNEYFKYMYDLLQEKERAK
jgi:hypothetical protein